MKIKIEEIEDKKNEVKSNCIPITSVINKFKKFMEDEGYIINEFLDLVKK